MIIILYIIKSVCISFVLFSYYSVFLRNKQFHQYNRFYLLGIAPVSLGLPLFNIPLPGISLSRHPEGLRLLKVIAVNGWEQEVIITANRGWMHTSFTWQNAAFATYGIVLLFLFYSFIRSIIYILRIRKKYPFEKIGDIRFFQTPESGTPFSFLKDIFWNEAIELKSARGKQVFLHELYHVKQHHTRDILWTELLSIVCWFNPVFHFIKKEIKVIHEFLADQYAASETDRYEYAELLVWQSAPFRQFSINHYFFHNQVKRRIMMITKFKNSNFGYISRLMTLPLFLLIFCAFAFRLTQKNNPIALVPAKTIIVAIDAGHGGTDIGTQSSTGILEKNLNLSIAKKIEELSKDYNVEIVMTRETDILPGNAGSIREGLINRIAIAEKNKADLFISIHMDASVSQELANGFSIYLSTQNPYYRKSVELGTILTNEIKKTYSILPELKERPSGIKILESTAMPAILIECGYMTNKNDLRFISDENNQTIIARDILKGIVKYASHQGEAIINTPEQKQDTSTPKAIQTDETGKVYKKVETEADYPGGSAGWSEYLMKNLKYPEEAVNKEIKGTVIAQFIVNTDGTLSDVKIIKSPSKILSDETLRIIKKSGNWIPAREKGQIVKSYKKQPIVFKLVGAQKLGD
jgi:TonB family protein